MLPWMAQMLNIIIILLSLLKVARKNELLKFGYEQLFPIQLLPLVCKLPATFQLQENRGVITQQ